MHFKLELREGISIWKEVENRLAKYRQAELRIEKQEDLWIADDSATSQYGSEYLTRSRLGQGAFRVLVADAYSRRCAVTGERTLPVLEAAHIKPYAESGPHAVRNGMLLRSDIHKLFDTGYITVTADYTLEVSQRIREEYENGKEYYRYHGKELIVLPVNDSWKPGKGYLAWHNEHVFRG